VDWGSSFIPVHPILWSYLTSIKCTKAFYELISLILLHEHGCRKAKQFGRLRRICLNVQNKIFPNGQRVFRKKKSSLKFPVFLIKLVWSIKKGLLLQVCPNIFKISRITSKREGARAPCPLSYAYVLELALWKYLFTQYCQRNSYKQHI